MVIVAFVQDVTVDALPKIEFFQRLERSGFLICQKYPFLLHLEPHQEIDIVRIVPGVSSLKHCFGLANRLFRASISSNKVLAIGLAVLGALTSALYFLRRSRQVSHIHIAEELRAMIPQSEKIQSVTSVKRGLSNTSFRVETDKGCYLLQKKKDDFNYSTLQQDILKVASEKKITPEIIRIEAHIKASLSQWTENAPWPAFKDNPQPYYDTMKLLQVFHRETKSQATDVEIHGPFSFIKKQGELTLKNGECPSSLQSALERIDRIFHALRPSFIPTICHGDFHKDNVLLVPENGVLAPRLIDFDNACVGEPFFDVAKFSLRESQETKMSLLAAYLGSEPTAQEKARFALVDLALLMVVAVNRFRLAQQAPGEGMTKQEMDGILCSKEPLASFLAVSFADGSKKARQQGALLALHEFLRKSEDATFNLDSAVGNGQER
jgi:thiamine kinase-like enzyme